MFKDLEINGVTLESVNGDYDELKKKALGEYDPDQKWGGFSMSFTMEVEDSPGKAGNFYHTWGDINQMSDG